MDKDNWLMWVKKAKLMPMKHKDEENIQELEASATFESWGWGCKKLDI